MNLKLGSQGAEVAKLQADLNKLGGNLVVDGDFGMLTLKDVQAFQSSHGLTVDGIVGANTAREIQYALGFPSNPSTTIAGIDIYHGDTVNSWAAIKASGINFCFIKATEGTHYLDPEFKKNWAACKQAGIIRGAYGFFHPSQDPVKQAEVLCSTVGILEPTDLPLTLDWEVTDDVSPSTDEMRGLTFLLKVEELSGKKPIIYGGPYFLEDMELSANFSGYPLWLAQYNTTARIPSPWKAWTFWQTGDSGHVPGMGNPVDMNKFQGTLDQLKEFIAKSAVK